MNSWQQEEAARATLAKKWVIHKPTRPGTLALAFPTPTTSDVDLASRRFITVQRPEDVVCERIFRSETATEGAACVQDCVDYARVAVAARDFDVIAFSVSFEWITRTFLRCSGWPRAGTRRGPDRPRSAYRHRCAITFVNPEPLAAFADVIAVGAGEELVPAFLDSFREGGSRADL